MCHQDTGGKLGSNRIRHNILKKYISKDTTEQLGMIIRHILGSDNACVNNTYRKHSKILNPLPHIISYHRSAHKSIY